MQVARCWVSRDSSKFCSRTDIPAAPLPMKAVEQELLRYSNAIRLLDDVTIIEARYLG